MSGTGRAAMRFGKRRRRTMKGESKEQALRNNLRDAGCGGKTVEQFLALEAEGKREAQLKLLFAHRQLLLRRLHREEQRIDCLDYLLHRMRKETAKTPF